MTGSGAKGVSVRREFGASIDERAHHLRLCELCPSWRAGRVGMVGASGARRYAPPATGDRRCTHPTRSRALRRPQRRPRAQGRRKSCSATGTQRRNTRVHYWYLPVTVGFNPQLLRVKLFFHLPGPGSPRGRPLLSEMEVGSVLNAPSQPLLNGGVSFRRRSHP